MIAALTFTAAATAASVAAGQAPQELEAIAAHIGQRVRVVDRQDARFDAPRTITGTLAQYDGSTLVLANGERQWAVPVHRVQRMHVSRGRRSMAGRGAAIGGTAGGLFGLAFGALCFSTCWDSEGLGAGGLLISTAAMGAIGAVAGAAIGAPFRGDKWERVRIAEGRPRVMIVPATRGMGVAVVVPFRRQR